MSTSPQAVPFPGLQHESKANQIQGHQGARHFHAAESAVSSDTIVQIVCDDSARVGSLTEFFSSHSMGVAAFRTASEYVDNVQSDRVACVILDLNLPDLSGLEVQRRLAYREGPPVVFVSAGCDLNSGVCAMKNGAIDFMIEPIDYSRLLAAVETALLQDRHRRRERIERSSLLRRWNSLTPREQVVFQYTVAGFLNKQAAAELGITENTFQVHRGRVMRKMEADSLAELVRMATRLEPLIPWVVNMGGPSQAPETFPRRQIRETSMSPITFSGTRQFGATGVGAAQSYRLQSSH
jgi:FixJ family two-component response regulator